MVLDYNKPVIPKTIHYCWFGHNKKNDLLIKCMASWKKFFPDYEIVEWNEDNFNVESIPYTKEAYENRKWAFVSDYARLYIIYHYGGIYFDTDVEVIRDFSHLINEAGYLGFENTSSDPGSKTVATGLGFAAAPKDKVIKALMDEYNGLHFIDGDGIMDLTPCPIRNTNALTKLGLRADGSMQKIGNIIIYPFEYFCGYDMVNRHTAITENTYTVHHYSGTWIENESFSNIIKYRYLIPALQNILGVENYDKIKKILKG